MYKKAQTWFDIQALERDIQKFWDESGAFDLLREKNKDGEIWSFLDGPITANNPMGIHHAWGRALKDAYQRYHAMNGRRLRYQNGFDCQGLWVEVEVEKELKFKSKRDIETYGVGRFVERCKERVRKYSRIQTEQSIRLGYWMDWDDSYYTMSDENNYTIWNFLARCHQRGLIYRGHDVMPWCPRCGTGISQHEMHEGYRTVRDVAIFSRFPIVGRSGEYFLVWTTTPWTLSSNVAIAVNKELKYAKVRQGDAIYYLSKALADAVCGRKGDYQVENEMPGAAFEGWLYKGPYDENANQEVEGEGHPVIFWDQVAETEGTGIVHVAPGCGKEDYELRRLFDLPLIAPIDEEGIFREGFGSLTGKFAGDVAQDVIGDLKAKGFLYATERYEHSYPHCWRCSTALLFRAVDEWYIAMDPWREEIKEVARKIRWLPSYGLDLELDWLSNMRDWMISKKRYWGLALPIWVCGECGHFEVMGSRDELKARATVGWEDFEGHTPHRPWVDRVQIDCSKCGGLSTRTKDVGNPWLDAGIVPYSTTPYNQDRKEWERWIPADLILECFPGQFRNWFYALLAMSTMMENRPPFRTLVGHALVRDEKSQEMHKSRGNAILFEDAADEAGVDVLRWVFCRHETTSNLNFGYGLTREVRGKFINTYWNTYAFYINYARIAGYRPGGRESRALAERPEFDRWILDRLGRAIENSRKGFDDYNLRRCALAAEGFIEDLSNWYIRHNRRRFWGDLDDPDVLAAFDTLFTCLDVLTRLITPIIPFLSEAIYQNMVRQADPEAPISVHLAPYPPLRPEWRDKELAARMESLARVTHLGLSAREAAGLRVRQPLAKVSISPAGADQVEALKKSGDFLKETLNVKAVEILDPGTPSPARKVIKPNYKTLGRKLGSAMPAFAEYLRGDNEIVGRLAGGESTFTIEFEGEDRELEKGDFLVENISPEGARVALDGDCWVMLDTRLTPELEGEGVMRDVLRKLQMTRRDVGLEIEDRCVVVYSTEHQELKRVMEEWAETIKEELLCTGLAPGPVDDPSATVKAGGGEMTVHLERASHSKQG